jgi:hypothetical protein
MGWLYFATIATLALWSLNEVRTPWPTVLGLGLFAIVCAVVTLDTNRALSRAATLLTVAVWPAVTALISWQLLMAGSFGHWFLGAGTASFFFISLRGRIAWAWVGFAAIAAITIVWGLTTEFGVGTAVLLVGKQFPILVVGTLFAIGLRRTTASVQQLTAETSARAASEAAEAAATAERDRRLAELDAFATPLLTLLVSGKELTADDRREFAVAEAELRDGLRARSLSVPSVVDAARQARRRGVDVLLLDDSDPGAVHPDDLNAVITQVSEAIADSTDGRVVARLLPPGRDAIATLVVDGTTQPRTVAIEPTH